MSGISAGPQNTDQGYILGNAAYPELIRRGDSVYVGIAGSVAADFAAQDFDGKMEYYQAAFFAHRVEESFPNPPFARATAAASGR